MNWTDADMWEAWRAGAEWVMARVDGALDDDGTLVIELPADDPGVTGLDWREEFGEWITDFEDEVRP